MVIIRHAEFEVDVNNRGYALLIPSSFAQRKRFGDRGKTPVEDEEEESDKLSSDGLCGSDIEDSVSGDSSDAGDRSTRSSVMMTIVD